MRDRTVALLNHQAFDTALAEIGGKPEADGPAADDQDRCMSDVLRWHRACLEELMRVGENHSPRSLVAILVIAISMVAALLLPAVAQIAGRTITIIVPYSPGTGIDILARA